MNHGRHNKYQLLFFIENYICIFLVKCIIFFHEITCIVSQLVFFTQQISWSSFYVSILVSCCRWVQLSRMDGSCFPVDGQSYFHFLKNYEVAMNIFLSRMRPTVYRLLSKNSPISHQCSIRAHKPFLITHYFIWEFYLPR